MLSWLLSLLIINSTFVSADSAFITGDSRFNPEITAYPSSSMTIFQNCNINLEQYDRFKGNLTLDTPNDRCPDGYPCSFERILLLGTGSMRPAMDVGYYRFRTGFINFSIGQIIMYDETKDKNKVEWANTNLKHDGNMHRIVDFQGDDLIVKGDANDFCELVPKSAVNGVLVGVYY